ncbi:Mth938-like domain-containing protein [Novispirillum sp. DQ9]|uniref:Mth938-like domain-containing protein n=1 Tax=Novispirillum sp. DQ9 TaxID=3398612 RepID=UPI003C79849F
MDITPTAPQGRQVIQGYGDGRFTVSGVAYEGAVLVFQDRTVRWPVTGLSDVTAESLEAVLERRPGVEILLLGCGPRMLPVPLPLRLALRERGLSLDPMDTGAACRTFNVLNLEDRRVAAALLPV